jgi:hypothetical protein
MKPARKRRLVKITSPSRQRSNGTHVLGRVNSDFAGFVWGMSEADVKLAANSISKHIEVRYQLELLAQSGVQIETE